MKGTYDPEAWQRQPNGFIAPEGYEPVPDLAAKNLVRLVNNLDPATILDVGCCDGRYFDWINAGRKFRPFGPGTYTGIDITPAFLARAKQRHPELDFQKGDVRKLPFESQSFEMVMCPNVLMHLPDIHYPIQEMCRVAKKYVVVSLYGAEDRHFETHDQNYLNHWYTWDEIQEDLPERFRMPIQWIGTPEWDKSKRIFQFCMSRKGPSEK